MTAARTDLTHHRLPGGATYVVLQDASAIDSLSIDWARLWAEQHRRSPMLEIEWVREWWARQGHLGDVFVVGVHEEGKLVGLAPLYIRRRDRGLRGLLRTVHFIGTGEPEIEEVCGENLGWLASERVVPMVTDAVARALRRHRHSWDRIVLQYMGPDTLPAIELQKLLAPLLLESSLIKHHNSVVNVSPLADYLGGLDSSSRRARFRRWLRRGEQAGVGVVAARTAAEALRMFDQLVQLHQSHWEARGEPGACSSASFREFHRAMIRHYAARDRLWVFGLKHEDRWIALHYDIEAGDTLYYYLSAIDPRASSKLSPGNLILLHAVDMAAGRGLRRLDLMAGDYDFKRHLSNDAGEMISFDGIGKNAVGRVWRGMRDVRRLASR